MNWFVLLFFSACSNDATLAPVKQTHQPNVLFISLDSVRADRIGAYGDPISNTPALDTLASHSVLYREAHSVSPHSTVSHASLMTGMLPMQHGVRGSFRDRLNPDQKTFSLALQEKGYVTGAFISNGDLRGKGFSKGFDRFDISPSESRRDAQTVNEAIAWWGSQDKPRMAWIQLSGGALPLTNLSESDGYRTAISGIDRLVGRLVASVGKATLISVISTHGESLWEHGERGHGVFLHRGVTRVPWILHPPRGMSGKQSPLSRKVQQTFLKPNDVDQGLNLDPVDDAPSAAVVIDRTVSLIDVAATLADYLSLDWESKGQSKRPPLLSTDDVAYAENMSLEERFGWPPVFMIQQANRRFETGLGGRSYFWQDDRQITPHQSDLTKLKVFSGLDDFNVDVDLRTHSDVILSLGESVVRPSAEAAVRLQKHMQQIDGIELPLKLAQIEMKLHRYLQALNRAELIMKENPHSISAALIAAESAYELDLFSKSRELSEHVLASDSLVLKAHRIRTAAIARLELPQELIEACESGLMSFPHDPELNRLMGIALHFQGRYNDALQRFKSVKGNVERPEELDYWLASALGKLSRIDESIVHYDRAAAKMPGDLRPLVQSGLLLLESNRCEEGRSRITMALKRGLKADDRIRNSMARCLQK